MPAIKLFMHPETRSITGVQIFATGKWNGDEYKIEDLDLMVDAWMQNQTTVRPYLKLGHDNEQKILQNDGLPAAGWVDRIYRQDDKLYADFSDIPQKIYDLIQRKAYRKVSVEIFLDVEIREKSYKYLIGAIALLGADTPGVMVLDDILAHYGLDSKTTVRAYSEIKKSEIKKYSSEINEPLEDFIMPKTEGEIKLELDLATAQAESKKFKADAEAKETALAEAKAEAEKTKAALEAANEKIFKAELDGKVQELINEKLITPSMKPFAEALIGAEKKEYSMKVEEKETKFTKFELIKEICKLFAATSKVNLEENSNDVIPEKTDAKKIETEIETYMTENKCSYKAAYVAVTSKFGKE